MNKIKRCIFHVPNYIDPQGKSGSSVRPRKMIKAFEDNGYQVDVIMGYTKDRKRQIKQIKENIKNGVKYDFMYSESSTMPTLLTEKNHLPLNPLLDFSFFKYCKKNNIKIGLFYRDIHWKFDKYKKEVNTFKRLFAITFYKYDLYKYRKLLNILYLPSYAVTNVLPKKNVVNCKYDIKELFPGCDQIKTVSKKTGNNINIFYVGGISEEVYNFEILFKVVNKLNNVKLTVCCRDREWDKLKNKYKKYLSNNITIIHKSGKDLQKYYDEADICSLFFKNSKYRDISMPIKLFEYLANRKPIIATKNTPAGDFVKENNIGWIINYDENEIRNLLKHLEENKDEIDIIRKNEDEIVKNHTWTARAKQVIDELK